MKHWPGSYLPALLIAGLALLPILVLFDLAWGPEPVFQARQWHVLTSTLALMGLTVLGAVLIGVPLALLTALVRLPWAPLWLIMLAAPLAMPSYLGAFAFFAAFGPGGEIERTLGIATPRAEGLLGASLVMALYTYPFVLLTTRAALRSQDGSLIHAARSLGLSLWGCVWRVVLPRAAAGIAAGALLAGLYALSDFGTPAIMNVDTFTRMIFVEYNAFGLSQAAVLSLQLLLLVGLILFLESRVRATEERAGRNLVLWPRPWQVPLALLGVLPVFVLAILLPLGIFLLWLLRDGAGDFDYQLAWNSTYVSLLAAGVAVLAALPMAYAALAGRVGRLAERISYLGFGVPGIVMGTALVHLGLKLPWLYQTTAVLVLAYVLRFLPLAVGAIRTSVAALEGSMERAARVLGAGPAETFRRVNLPLTLRGVIAGGALVFLEVMRELPATLLLAPIGFETLATYMWRVYEAGYFGQAAVPGLLLILMSGLGLALIFFGERRAEFEWYEEGRD